jgi:hypothetical protein
VFVLFVTGVPVLLTVSVYVVVPVRVVRGISHILVLLDLLLLPFWSTSSVKFVFLYFVCVSVPPDDVGKVP